MENNRNVKEETLTDETAEALGTAANETAGEAADDAATETAQDGKKPKKEKVRKEKSRTTIVVERVIKTVLFLGIFCVILYLLCDVFEYENNYMRKSYERYKMLEPGTVDAVLVGTSGINRSWIASKGFDKFGITVYPFSTDAMPCWVALDAIKEAYRFQDPELVIMDMRMFVQKDPSYNVELCKTQSRRFIDVVDFFSPNRIDAIKRTRNIVYECDNTQEKYDITYFLNFIMYHSMWADEGFDPISEIGCPPSAYYGFYLTRMSVTSKKVKASKWTDDRLELSTIASDCLNEIIDYCGENNIKLMFVDTPHKLSKEEMCRTNRLCDILEARGIDYMRYSDKMWYRTTKYDEYVSVNEDTGWYQVNFNGMTWDFETWEEVVYYMETHTFSKTEHFYDDNHLNFDGAVIFTRLLGDYLVTNYALTDHSEDPKCAGWEAVYKKTKKKIKRLREAYGIPKEDEVD